MGRPLRVLVPNQLSFVTQRCVESRFLLRPDVAAVEIFKWCLAKALARYPSIRCLGVCSMSNHEHLILKDETGDLSRFWQYFASYLARSMNRLRRRSGPFFHRRFSCEPILDQAALRDRTAYLAANPVAARLVSRTYEWPGLLLWASRERRLLIAEKFHERRWREAVRRAKMRDETPPAQDEFVEKLELVIHPITDEHDLPQGAEILPEGLSAGDDVVRRIKEICERLDKEKPQVLGAQAVLDTPPDSQPKFTKKSNRPLCHTSCPDMWRSFLEATRKFRCLYDDASEAFRAGFLNTPFPEFTFRPPGWTIHGPLPTI